MDTQTQPLPQQVPTPIDAHFVEPKKTSKTPPAKLLKFGLLFFLMLAIPVSYISVKNFKSPGSRAAATLMTIPKPTLTPTPTPSGPTPTPPLDLRRADINQDGVVNISDFNILKAQMGKTCTPSSTQFCADIDCSQGVDQTDVTLLQSVFGKTVDSKAPRCPYLMVSPIPTQPTVRTKMMIKSPNPSVTLKMGQ